MLLGRFKTNVEEESKCYFLRCFKFYVTDMIIQHSILIIPYIHIALFS